MLIIQDSDAHGVESILNFDLRDIENWCLQNQIVLNVDKSKCMLMGTQQRKSELHSHILKIQISGQSFIMSKFKNTLRNHFIIIFT